jgi:hypothetical protein
MSIWVVGLHRDGDRLLAMNHDVTSIHTSMGFRLHEEIILAHKNNGAIQRVGNFEKGRNLLIRMHEYALVFESLKDKIESADTLERHVPGVQESDFGILSPSDRSDK